VELTSCVIVIIKLNSLSQFFDRHARKNSFEKTYKIQLVRGKLAKEEEKLAKRPFEEKYCKDEWNYRMWE